MRFFSPLAYRQLSLSVLPGILLGATAAFAAARPVEDLPMPYELPGDHPADIDEVRDVVGTDGVTKNGEIFSDLSERAVCGGWDFEDSVGQRSDSKIARAQGVPGRLADPLGNLTSGMAARIETGGAKDDGYLFPTSTEVRGWSTACQEGTPPFFQTEPTCMDESLGTDPNARDAGDWAHPAKCQDICVRMNNWQRAAWVCVDVNNPLDPLDDEVIGQHADEPCERGSGEQDESKGKGCAAKYEDGNGDNAADPTFDPGISVDGGCTEGEQRFYAWFYGCTSAQVTAMQYELCTEEGSQCGQHPDGTGRNCVRCEGDGAPVEQGDTEDFNGEPIDRNEVGCRESGTAHQSFFRHYINAGYERATVAKVQSDVGEREGIKVACYGLYNEFDAKTTSTMVDDQPDNHMCVIGAYTPDNTFQSFWQTQRGRGDFGQTSSYPDPNPTDATQLRTDDFDAAKDLWYPQLGEAFSLLNMDALKKVSGGDLTYALFHPDTARLRSTVQLTEERPLSEGALIRSTDDTVTNESDQRSIVEWWQGLQTTASPLLTPPTVWLVLPAAWSFDLDPLHPLFTLPEAEQRPKTYEPRRQTVEVQLEARDDLLGNVADYLTNSLLVSVVQEPMTVIVPLGSSTDFRAYKEGWLRWIEFHESTGNEVPPEAQILVDQLESYAVHIDEVRRLRTELAQYAGTLLKRQNKIRTTIADWLETNLDEYEQFKTEQETLRSLSVTWQEIQDRYRTFHDVTTMPWCKNDRFTTPIYSLLDPWMPERPDLSGDALPTLTLPPMEDGILDFSGLHLSQSGTIRLPVLSPVQVRYDNKDMTPPALFDREPVIPTLPELPPVPSITATVEEELLLIDIAEEDTFPTISTYLPDINSNDLQNQLDQISTVIEEMDARYNAFWQAVTKPMCGTPEGEKRCEEAGESAESPTQTCCVEEGQEVWCKALNTDTCVHFEGDLLERLVRMGARPAVQLREDFAAAGSFRAGNADVPAADGPACSPADWACLRLLPQVTYPRIGWRIDPPTEQNTESVLSALRVRLFEETVLGEGVPGGGQFPLNVPKNALTPSFHVWPDIPLIPAGKTPDSSASSVAPPPSSSPF